jgi:hypothetical protein
MVLREMCVAGDLITGLRDGGLYLVTTFYSTAPKRRRKLILVSLLIGLMKRQQQQKIYAFTVKDSSLYIYN